MAKSIGLWCDHVIALLKNVQGEAGFKGLAFQNIRVDTLIPINKEMKKNIK